MIVTIYKLYKSISRKRDAFFMVHILEEQANWRWPRS